MEGFSVQKKRSTRSVQTFASGGPPSISVVDMIAYQGSLSASPKNKKGNFRDPNAFNYNFYERGELVGSRLQKNPFWTTLTTGVIGSPPLASPSILAASDSAYNQCLQNLGKKVRGSLDLSVAVGESKTTLKMLNLVERLREGMTYMKKGWLRALARKVGSTKTRRSYETRFRDNREFARALVNWQNDVKLRYPRFRPVPVNAGLVSKVSKLGANGWLEFTYGWKPLCSDIRDVASNIINSQQRKLQSFRARGSVSLNAQSKANFEGIPAQQSLKGKACWTITAIMQQGFDPTFSKWTSLNPFSIAYELTPLSFVVDWFIDFSGYMRSLETALIYRTSVKSICYSELRFWTSGVTISGSKDTVSVSASGFERIIQFNRTTGTTFPFPQAPRISVNLGSSRLLSAASLMRQLLK